MLQKKFVKFSPDTKFIREEVPKIVTPQQDEEAAFPSQSYLMEIISVSGIDQVTNLYSEKKDSSSSQTETRMLNELITGTTDLVNPYHTTLLNEARKKSGIDTIAPFVTIYHGKSWIHNTKKATSTIENSLDPVWTVETDSLFLVQLQTGLTLSNMLLNKNKKIVTQEENGRSYQAGNQFSMKDDENQLLFILNRFKKLGNIVEIGRASISFSTVLDYDEGSRIDIPLYNLDNNNRSEKQETLLSIRYRKATESDIQFLSHSSVSNTRKTHSTKHKPMCNNYKSLISPNLIKTTSTFRNEQNFGNTKNYVSVPPNPNIQPHMHQMNDEEEEDRQKLVTEKELDAMMWQPSTSWTVLNGDGNFGSLYIEVIQCTDLLCRHKEKGQSIYPDDTTEKNDPFVTIVHEDAIISTDALQQCNNPKFMPWSKRAFKFHNIQHSYSPVFVGVFDYSDAKHGLGGLLSKNKSKKQRKYNEIGRCAISVYKLKPNVTYNMVYDLYQTLEEQEYKRVKEGSITLRIRVQWNDERKLFFDFMNPKSVGITVNAPTKADIVNINFTLNGNKDMTSFKMDYIYEMVDELMEYYHYFHSISTSMKSLYWWKYPLHSLFIFVGLNIAVEFPQYSISVFFAFITYTMLWLLSIQREHSSEWQKPPLYSALLLQLFLGRSFTDKINQYQNQEEDKNYDTARHKLEQWNDEKTLQFYQSLEQQWSNDDREKREYKVMMNQKKFMNKSRFKLENISKTALYPMQINLWKAVIFMRFVDRVVKWDHLYVSFWITTVSLVLTIVTAVSIWTFNGWLWFQRLALWLLFGPWNYFLHKQHHKTQHVLTTKNEDEKQQRRQEHQKNKTEDACKRTIQENNIKAAAMRKCMFGDYGVKVPDLWKKSERKPFTSVPQVASFTKRSSIKELDGFIDNSSQTKHVMGQTIGISGSLIPHNYLHHLQNNVTSTNGNNKNSSLIFAVDDNSSIPSSFTDTSSLEKDDDIYSDDNLSNSDHELLQVINETSPSN